MSWSVLKDLVYPSFLAMSGCDILATILDARVKDGDWERVVVSMLLDDMRVEGPPDWLVREVSVDEFEAFTRNLRLGLAERALPPV